MSGRLWRYPGGRQPIGASCRSWTLPKTGADGLMVSALGLQIAERVNPERQLRQRSRRGAELGNASRGNIEDRLMTGADQPLSQFLVQTDRADRKSTRLNSSHANISY